MNREIQIRLDKNYGRRCAYIKSNHREAVESLTGKLTLTRGAAIALGKLGFTFCASFGSSNRVLPMTLEDVLEELD